MPIITEQELTEASQDAKSLEDMVNGAANINSTGIVTTRSGQQIKTLAKIEEEINAEGQGWLDLTEQFATDSENSSVAAQNSANGSEQNVAYAEEWANNPQNTFVSANAGGNGTSDYSALHYSAESKNFRDEAQTYRTIAAQLAEDSVLASKAPNEVYPTTSAALSNGVNNIEIITGGNSGTNGVYPLGITGGGGINASAVFTVDSGQLRSITITNSGEGYTSIPTLDFSADTTLASIGVVTTISPNRGVGQYFTTPDLNGDNFFKLYKVEAGPVATLVTESFIRNDMPIESGYVAAWTDSEGNASIAIDNRGKVWLNLSDEIDIQEVNLDQTIIDRLLAGSTSLELDEQGGFVYAITDQTNAIAFGIKIDGSCVFKPSEEIPITQSTIDAVNNTIDSSSKSSSSIIVHCGDSMTQGGTTGSNGIKYPTVVGNNLSRSIENLGLGGQNSKQIMCRQGAISLRLVLTGNSIPATGGVAVTNYNIDVLSYSGTFHTTFTGTLSGIHGTISSDSNNNWTFTRTTGGLVTNCPPSSVFIFDNAINNRKNTLVMWAGRNNYLGTEEVRNEAVNEIYAGWDYLAPTDKRMLVLSVTNGLNEGAGSAAYTNITEFNKLLESKFGYRYVDVRGYLIAYGLDEAGITPTAQDIIDVAADTVPESLRGDGIHLTGDGLTIVGNLVSNELKTRGWE
jgi:hypothetical protein